MKTVNWVIALCVFLLPIFTGCVQYSEGSRAGVITKFSKKGVICKSYEGTMSIGFMKDGQGTVSSEEWHFTVEDPAIVKAVEEAATSGRPVKLSYSQELFEGICRSDTDYFITAVQYVQ